MTDAFTPAPGTAVAAPARQTPAPASAQTPGARPDAIDSIAQTPENTCRSPENGFALLGLAAPLLQAVADLGFTQPTAVQSKVIPLAVAAASATPPAARAPAAQAAPAATDTVAAATAADRADTPPPAAAQAHAAPPNTQPRAFNDLMVSSQTGSGKTAAFLLPVLHTLLLAQAEAEAAERAQRQRLAAEAAARGEAPPKKPRRKNPTDPRHFKPAQPGALVLTPTRELAQQVAADAIDLVRHCRGLRIANVVGGIPYQLQIAKLQNADLVVATPGRLLDLQRSGQIRLDAVRFLVLDEADRMLDLGFADDLAEVHQLTHARQQTMMFSATFAPRIQQLALRVMHNGGAGVRKVQIDSPQEKHANITQKLFWADNPQHKRALLDHWLRDAAIDQAIVFASTQIECDALAVDLQQAGFSAVALHGALSQGLRNRRLAALRDGRVQILVATDVAARGIDVPTITHVFNFGLPMKAEDYTHRIGRTGRAGRDGLAVTFAEFRDRHRIFDIENYTHQHFKADVVPGLEPTQRFPASGTNKHGRSGFADHGPQRAKRGGPPGAKFAGKFSDQGASKAHGKTAGKGGGFGGGFGGGLNAGFGGGFNANPGKGFGPASGKRPPRGPRQMGAHRFDEAAPRPPSKRDFDPRAENTRFTPPRIDPRFDRRAEPERRPYSAGAPHAPAQPRHIPTRAAPRHPGPSKSHAPLKFKRG